MIEKLRRTVVSEPLRLDGKIPDDLRGRLYRVGPGAIRRFGKAVHPFLADGAIHQVRFGERVFGSSRMIETAEYLREERAGKVFSGPNSALWRRLHAGLMHHVKSTGNTSVLYWQERLYALMEAGLPVEVDPETLLAHPSPTTLGFLTGGFSAHPHRVRTHRAQYNFTVDGKVVRVFCFPDEKPAQKVGEFELPHLGLIHDFMVTETHAIFFVDPGRLRLWRAALQWGDFSDWFSWDPNGQTEIVLVPLDSSGKIERFELGPLRVWHFVNAYNRGVEVVIDVIRHADLGALLAPTGDGSKVTDPRLTRFVVNRQTRGVREEILWETVCEFPRVRPRDEGVEYGTAWVQTFDDDEGTTGFARVELASGVSHRYCAPKGMVTSEPVVVEGTSNPWVLQLEGNEEACCVAIHDGRSAEGPVARAFLSEPIPPTFHGIFVPDGALSDTPPLDEA